MNLPAGGWKGAGLGSWGYPSLLLRKESCVAVLEGHGSLEADLESDSLARSNQLSFVPNLSEIALKSGRRVGESEKVDRNSCWGCVYALRVCWVGLFGLFN